MKIVAHKLVDVEYHEATAFAPTIIKPELIVLHDTAGHLDKGNCVDWFTNPNCNVSAHLIIERDGTIVQCVPFNQRAYHAGRSQWKGRPDCNGWAIGIEIVNPGLLDKDGRAWFHKQGPQAKWKKGYPTTTLKKALVPNSKTQFAWWMPYTAEQIASVTAVCRTLVGVYGITDITTHWAIRPGDKVDTNPLFPLEDVRRVALAPKPSSVPAALMAVDGAAGVAAAAAEAPEIETVASVVVAENGEPEGRKWFSSAQFAEVNALAAEGSTLAARIRNYGRWLWLLLFGAPVGGTGVAHMVDPNKGAPAVAGSWASQHPFLFASIVGGGVLAIMLGLGFWYLKGFQQSLLRAAKGGRYEPPATVKTGA
jgi:N-acetylmuramoyl-L-alanine amidase